MSEGITSAVPANNIGGGAIEKIDPIMTAKPVKRLRDIIGSSSIKKDLNKEKSRGI